MVERLVEAIVGMQDDLALEIVQQLLQQGTDVNLILAGCQKAMGIVGEKFEQQEFFLPELIMSGEILKEITELVKPLLQGDAVTSNKLGKVVIGTVEGDIHDIGKDIVVFMLEVNGFEVFDIGVDAPSGKFVEKIKEVNPDVVGLSGFLTHTFDKMKETVDAIAAAGYRDKVKIMIGGGTVTDDIRLYTGADAFGQDAMAAVAFAKDCLGGGTNE